MPRRLDGSPNNGPRHGCLACGGTRSAMWTGRFLLGWRALFFLSCLLFRLPFPLHVRGEKFNPSPDFEADAQHSLQTKNTNNGQSEGQRGSDYQPITNNTIDPSPGGNEKEEKLLLDVALKSTTSSGALLGSAALQPSDGRSSNHPAENPTAQESNGKAEAAEVDIANPTAQESNGKGETAAVDIAAANGVSREDDWPSIQAIHKPFLQQPHHWRVEGHGISIKTTGEPKSGTTFLGTLFTHLCVVLCGSYNNQWCEMGGLVVTPNVPAARYEFEMIDKEGVHGRSPGLYMHFKGDEKHIIMGMDDKRTNMACRNGGRFHWNFFQESPPCKAEQQPTRSNLMGCLWNTSTECQPKGSPLDPSVIRNVFIVRDPRNVVMSERRMRINYYKDGTVIKMSADDFVRTRFEALVSWTHQRWTWHRCDAMKNLSHIVLYEDLQATHMELVDIASFLDLECTPEQALHVWEAHRQINKPSGDYSTRGLQPETIRFMNATMAKLLPVPLVHRYGLVPTDV